VFYPPGKMGAAIMEAEVHKRFLKQREKRIGPRGGPATANRKSAKEVIRKSEEQFRTFIDRHDAVMLLIDPDSGAIVDANQAAIRFYGYSKEELYAMNIADINQLAPEQVAAERQHAIMEKQNRFISPHKLANNEIRTVEVYSTPINLEGQALLFTIMHDVTEREKCEQDLKMNVEQIEELNAALKVILRQMEESREELSARIFSNIKEIILPNVDKLKKSSLSSYQRSLLQSIESNLMNISSSFLRDLKMTSYGLTPREIEIATLVKEGKSSKEMSERMGISPKTVAFHRDSLRKKLGLNNKKTNLRSHLSTIR
jgi:PAS domain S-box-containing protein